MQKIDCAREGKRKNNINSRHCSDARQRKEEEPVKFSQFSKISQSAIAMNLGRGGPRGPRGPRGGGAFVPRGGNFVKRGMAPPRGAGGGPPGRGFAPGRGGLVAPEFGGRGRGGPPGGGEECQICHRNNHSTENCRGRGRGRGRGGGPGGAQECQGGGDSIALNLLEHFFALF